jgi:DNA recombination protein RmuC
VLDGKFRSAITDLATASERASRADALAGQVEQARALLLDAQGEVATLRANATHFEEQKRLLLEAQDALRQQFEASGARVLAQAQEALLPRRGPFHRKRKDQRRADECRAGTGWCPPEGL